MTINILQLFKRLDATATNIHIDHILRTDGFDYTEAMFDLMQLPPSEVDDVITYTQNRLQLLNDLYTYLIPPSEIALTEADVEGSFAGTGILINLTSDGLVVTNILPNSPAAQSRIVPNSRIVQIDNHTVTQPLQSTSMYCNLIRGKVDTTVTITVESKGVQTTHIIRRAPIKLSNINHRIMNEVCYIEILDFTKHTVPDLKSIIKSLPIGCKGIIFDVRNNAGGLLDAAIGTLELLMKGHICTAEYKNSRDTRTVSLQVVDIPFTILTSQTTASAAEIFTAALKNTPGTRVIGEPTFGKSAICRIQRVIRDSAGLHFRIGQWWTPENTLVVETGGVQPHIHTQDFLNGTSSGNAEMDAIIRDILQAQ